MRLRFPRLSFPLKTFQMVGDWSKPKSFKDPADFKVLQSSNYVSRLNFTFSKTRHDWAIWMVNTELAADYLESRNRRVETGQVRPQWVNQTFGVDWYHDPNAINIVFTNNEGNAKIPMTPWIVAHRIGHALVTGNAEFKSELVGHGIHYLMSLARLAEWVYSGFTGTAQYYNYNTAAPTLMHLINHIGTMASVRNQKLANVGEFIIESFAQHLVEGRISFGKIPKRLILDRADPTTYFNLIGTIAENQPKFEAIAAEYSQNIEKCLDQLVGKVFVI